MTRLPLSARCSCLLLAVLLLVCSPALANPSSLVAATASRPRTENAYVFVYSHDAKDAQAKLLGTRVTIRSLQVTRPKYEIVVLVSPSTPEGVRQIFQGYGARVVDAIDRFNSSAASAPLSTGSTTWYPVTRAAAKEPVDALTFYTARKTFRESYYATKCPYNRDFLYVYTLTEYRRVLYIEAEALVYRNLDEMFNCGHFCLTYANENCWNSGIMVIKPDMNEFNRFVSHFMDKNAAFEKDAHNRILFKPKIPCFEEYHDSLLIMYPSIEAAPLFYANKGPQEAPVMRINLLYSVNAIFFYEHFHWTLYRLNLPLDVHGKSYDPAKYRLVDETTLSQALDTSKDDGIQWGIPNDVPAFVMSFYHPQPWYWWEAAYFDLNWYWQDMRYLLLPDTPTVVMNTVFSRLSMLLVLYLVVEYLMNANFTPEFREKMLVYWGGSSFGFSQTTDTADKMRQIFINDNDSTPVKPGHQSGLSQVVTILVHLFRVPISVRFKGIVAGILLGVFAIVSTTVILVIPVIPNTTPPSWAWPIFCLYQNFWIYVFLRTVMNVFPNPESLVPYIDVRLSSFAGAIILEAVTLAHNKANLHKHFVEKILAFAIFLALIWLLQTRHFRKYMVNRFEAQEAQAKGSVKQEKV